MLFLNNAKQWQYNLHNAKLQILEIYPLNNEI